MNADLRALYNEILELTTLDTLLNAWDKHYEGKDEPLFWNFIYENLYKKRILKILKILEEKQTGKHKNNTLRHYISEEEEKVRKLNDAHKYLKPLRNKFIAHLAEYAEQKEVLHKLKDGRLKSHIDFSIKCMKEVFEKISVEGVSYVAECVNTGKEDAKPFLETIDFGFKKKIPFKILHRHLEFFKQSSDKQSAIKEVEDLIYSILEIFREQFEIKIRPLNSGEWKIKFLHLLQKVFTRK